MQTDGQAENTRGEKKRRRDVKLQNVNTRRCQSPCRHQFLKGGCGYFLDDEDFLVDSFFRVPAAQLKNGDGAGFRRVDPPELLAGITTTQLDQAVGEAECHQASQQESCLEVVGVEAPLHPWAWVKLPVVEV